MYPDLGDSNKTYTVELTEPEINTIAAMIGYTRDGILQALEIPARFPASRRAQQIMKAWLDHYHAGIQSLDEKLAKFDD